ncbi:MAG: TauD/TfdA family dioxygenase [Pseudomonadota bacterium]
MTHHADPKQFSRFQAWPMTPAIGAEIEGIDLRTLSDDLIAELRQALLKYQVLFFRDQDIEQRHHIAFAKAFGHLEIHPATPKDQVHREVLRISHGPRSRGSENRWHSDVTWRAEPSLGSILRAIEIPPVGGDTLFANMQLAYDRLDDTTKDQITGLTAVHDIARVFAKRLNLSPEALHEKYPLIEHPVVRTHPETGARTLYVNAAFTSHIKDMSRAESDTVLERLYRTAANPEIQCRFRWTPGSIAFWDNRACQHFAASDYYPSVRVMERVTIAGCKPYFDAAA